MSYEKHTVKSKMACFLPLPLDMQRIIAYLKRELETKSYEAFFEDFDVELLDYKEELGEQLENFYFPLVTETCHLKITYKPTGLSFEKTLVARSCTSTPRLTPFFIKKFAIQDVHNIARDLVKGKWSCSKDSDGFWYHCEKLPYNVVRGEEYKQWQKQTRDLQRVMMNRFDKFIAV